MFFFKPEVKDFHYTDRPYIMYIFFPAVTQYLLLTEFEGRTVSYGPSFFLLDLWPKREARGP